MRIYLDTSVYGGYYDNGNYSVDLIDAINELGITVLYSKIVTDELRNAKIPLKFKLKKVFALIKRKKNLRHNSKTRALANEYIIHGVLTRKSIDDAQHIALAVLNKADYIVSWNFKDMVNKNEQYKSVSKLLKLKQVPIFPPDEFLTEILKLKLKWTKEKKKRSKDH